MNKPPSLLKIITVDYSAFLGCLLPVLMWGIYIVIIALGIVKTNDPTLPILFATITFIALFILIWRIQIFKAVFNSGIETTAIINHISFFRDGGRVGYVYTYQGQEYTSSNAIQKGEETLALKLGEQVILVVDRNNPKRAFIRAWIQVVSATG